MSPKSFLLSQDLHRYMVEHSSALDPVRSRLIEETVQLGPIAGMQVAPEQSLLMTLLARMVGAEQAVEVGTFTGLSALSIALGMPETGRLLCCDVSEEWTSIARRYWKEAGVEDRIELRIAPAIETLRRLPADPVIDLAFIDADKTGYIGYWEELVPRVRPGGVLLIDNVLQGGRITDAGAGGESLDAIRAFNDHASADPRVELVVLPVSDGLTLAHKR